MKWSNKTDVVNPAMAVRFTIQAHLSRVTDLERWTLHLERAVPALSFGIEPVADDEFVTSASAGTGARCLLLCH